MKVIKPLFNAFHRFKVFKAVTQINSNIYLSIKNLRYVLRPHNKVNNKYELSNEKNKNLCALFFYSCSDTHERNRITKK